MSAQEYDMGTPREQVREQVEQLMGLIFGDPPPPEAVTPERLDVISKYTVEMLAAAGRKDLPRAFEAARKAQEEGHAYALAILTMMAACAVAPLYAYFGMGGTATLPDAGEDEDLERRHSWQRAVKMVNLCAAGQFPAAMRLVHAIIDLDDGDAKNFSCLMGALCWLYAKADPIEQMQQRGMPWASMN